VATATGVARLVETHAEPGGHLVHAAKQLVVLRDGTAGVEGQRHGGLRRAGVTLRPPGVAERHHLPGDLHAHARGAHLVLGQMALGDHGRAEAQVVDARSPAQVVGGDVGRRALGAADGRAVLALQPAEAMQDLGDVDVHAADARAGAALGAAPEVVALQRGLNLAREDEAHEAPRATVELATTRAAGRAGAALVASGALGGQPLELIGYGR